jgi:hypothetical protein
MFGLSAFSESPVSAIFDNTDSGWQTIRSTTDSWIATITDNTFLVRASDGVLYECSLTVLSSSAVAYVVGLTLLSSTRSEFVPSANLWQDSSTSSNVWV